MQSPRPKAAIDLEWHEPGYGPSEETMLFASLELAEKYADNLPPHATIILGPYEFKGEA